MAIERHLAIVTGTGGIGLEAAAALAKAGATVILAGRNAAAGQAAVSQIGATARFEPLDLASLSSIAGFAERMAGEGRAIDLLINNAAVMALPRRRVTADGFEMQLGINHLGHFALTLRLLPLLRQAKAARVVTVGSIAARRGRMRFDDLNSERRYSPLGAYAQAKLANLLFALELQRRSVAGGWGIASFPVHPGVARTALISSGAGPGSLLGLLARFGGPLMMQSAAAGALPLLRAATDPDAVPGTYYGPHGFRGIRGRPVPVALPRQAENVADATRLWEISERLTGLSAPRT